MNNDSGALPSDIESLLRENAADLLHRVEGGDFIGAVQIIHRLNEVRDKSLYQEVGKLTRALHESIKSLELDTEMDADMREQAGEELNGSSDASNRLAYVVELTDRAAHKTMDKVEESMPIAEELSKECQHLREQWGNLKQVKPSEFRELYKKMDEFLDHAQVRSNNLCNNLSEILMAQDYQDLTGQVINRVTDIVKQVESSLLNMVLMAGRVDQITGMQHGAKTEDKKEAVDPLAGEGPQIHAEERPDVVSGQDEVDDLLSSLGF